jgi:hypothetical protein
MSLDHASAFYMAASETLSADDPGVTPGDRAIAHASLAQVEVSLIIAELIEKASSIPNGEIARGLLEAEDCPRLVFGATAAVNLR